MLVSCLASNFPLPPHTMIGPPSPESGGDVMGLEVRAG